MSFELLKQALAPRAAFVLMPSWLLGYHLGDLKVFKSRRIHFFASLLELSNEPAGGWRGARGGVPAVGGLRLAGLPCHLGLEEVGPHSLTRNLLAAPTPIRQLSSLCIRDRLDVCGEVLHFPLRLLFDARLRHNCRLFPQDLRLILREAEGLIFLCL